MRLARWAGFLAGALVFAASSAVAGTEFNGFNVIVSPGHPFGSSSALASIKRAQSVGANTIAIVPFLWQENVSSADISRGTDMDDRELRAALRGARALGLKTIVKPHVWVDGAWAGAIVPANDAWTSWFEAYKRHIVSLARIASEEQADIFCIGTELARTTSRPEWSAVIAAVREIFSGKIAYVGHNADEAEVVPFWEQIDLIGVSLYPPLIGDRVGIMNETARRLDAIAARTKRSILVGEIGLRSAQGAAAKPWESAEEREADPDMQVQADILSEWLQALKRPSVAGVLVWRWFTDPNAGGPLDTDFTVQGKLAEEALRCAWRACGR